MKTNPIATSLALSAFAAEETVTTDIGALDQATADKIFPECVGHPANP